MAGKSSGGCEKKHSERSLKVEPIGFADGLDMDDKREESRLLRDGGFSFWSNENVLKLTVVMVAQLGDYTKNHCIVHFQWVSCTIFGLYLNNIVSEKRMTLSFGV